MAVLLWVIKCEAQPEKVVDLRSGSHCFATVAYDRAVVVAAGREWYVFE
jgi:hypothetical protein